MDLLMAIVVGVLYGSAAYALLRRSLVKIVIGLMLLSHASNLLIFVTGGLGEGAPVFIDAATGSAPAGHADPLPQALILTAIVIGFGILAFTLVLLKRAYRSMQADDLDCMKENVE
jgi:multicomponent Na+:H+ antiporter subunit C